MTYWHKVQMSCRQTQPVVLRRSVWFRHSSLFRHQASGRVNSSSACALCGIGIVAYVATFLVGIFHLPLSRSYLASLEKLCVRTAAGESAKIRSGHPANDSVERFVDALTIERLVLYLKVPKRKQACWSCADWSQVGYKLTSLNILIVKVRNWSMDSFIVTTIIVTCLLTK